ncbi:MogA/MoaB family molybdenum cofactor biosynthesis protein [Erysipelotrichaceae bacterium OttesenSCG-928-M19]|nr:MogA/MoaB family molybdenum cofactor biosynthesis protein [Erysipelotrichaceae bacterium OttesenSCG-928-M19]
MYSVAIITLSNRVTQGVYEDKSGLFLKEFLTNNNFLVNHYEVIKDEQKQLRVCLDNLIDKVDLIITTGGTGLTSQDITVDVVEKYLDYEIRGVSIAMHQLSLNKAASAMFSRALCGVKNKTMIITLPGSLKAVSEIIEYLQPHLEHGLDHLNDVSRH